MDENEDHLAEWNFTTNVNHKEVADKVKGRARELGFKLFFALLVGSGVAILSIITVIASDNTSNAMKDLLTYSLWAFCSSLIFAFLSGLCLYARLEYEAEYHLCLANKQNLDRTINDAFKQVGGLSEFDEESRRRLIQEQKKSSEYASNARACYTGFLRATKYVSRLQLISSLCFLCGIIIPLLSITIYDYF